jgi:CBS domain-containing protein
MAPKTETTLGFLSEIHPYGGLAPEDLADVAKRFSVLTLAEGDEVYRYGQTLEGLYIILHGAVEVRDENDKLVSLLRRANSFGERGLLRTGFAVTKAKATQASTLLLLPAADFHALVAAQPAVQQFFDRSHKVNVPVRPASLTNTRVDRLMATNPVTCPPDTSIRQAAQLMRDNRISSIAITEGTELRGIFTLRDINNHVVADGMDTTLPVHMAMTKNPKTLPTSAIGSDVLHMMAERGFGHVPVVENGRLVGMVTQTNLTRFQAETSANLVRDIARARDVTKLAAVSAKIPQMLVQLVGAGNRHEVVTRLITDIADAITRRLLALAEAELGAAPVPYLWAACGSQGRQEQTGVSDQDNCLLIDDAATEADMAYFAALAGFVCDGLNTCGYVYCPGDMMASNPRWCQPLRVWRRYFKGWIDAPDTEAQMLASVMFDLRAIGGASDLLEQLQAETLGKAAKNSIFVAHMVGNSLKHAPPLGLIRGFATLRSGEHKNRLDLKMGGVVPLVDLGRIYALRGALALVNTRARIEAAIEARIISESGGRDLMDAYDLIAQTRLDHQMRQIKAGTEPDNYMSPSMLSDFERSHLRDAFVVVRTMQSAAGQGRGIIG